MPVDRMKLKKSISTLLFLLFFGVTVILNASCEPDDNPASDADCGIGPKTWDSKAQVCRDQNNTIVPPRCCGQF